MGATILLLGLLLAGDLADSAERDASIGYQLLLPGQYHGNSVSAVSGEQWWAVLQTGAGQVLRPVTIDVAAIHDDMMNDKEGEKTGKVVSTREEQEGKCLFMVKGLKNPKPGPIEAFFVGQIPLWPQPEPHNEYPARCINIELGKETALEIVATGSMKDLGSDYAIDIDMGPDHAHRLGSGIQRVFQCQHTFDYAIPTLLWVGDVDRDGKPDLLLDLATKYVLSLPTLYLSSERQPGEHVKKVADFPSAADG